MKVLPIELKSFMYIGTAVNKKPDNAPKGPTIPFVNRLTEASFAPTFAPIPRSPCLPPKRLLAANIAGAVNAFA